MQRLSPNAYPFPVFVDVSLWVLALIEIALVTIYTLPISFLNIKRRLVEWAAFSAFLQWAEWLYYPTCLFYMWVIVFEAAEYLFGEALDTEILLKMQARFLLALFNYVLIRLLKRMYFLLRNNAEAVLRFEEGSIKEREIKESIDNFAPPSLQSMKLQLGLYKWLASPQFHGWENIPNHPTRPLIFVGNHAIVGLEVPLLLYELYKQKHIFPRAMGDHTHFKIPVWGKILSAFGVVDGTREICGRILSRGQHILIYPGGAREVMKRKTDKKYSLLWANRTGFARMAIQYNCTIIPIVTVGTEDMLEIIYDLPAGWLFGGRDITAPIVIPPTPSKLQRLYFYFGEPIETHEYNGDYENIANCEALRDRTKKAVEKGLEDLQEIQSKDPDRLVKDRLARHMKRKFPTLSRRKLSIKEKGIETENETESDKEKEKAAEERIEEEASEEPAEGTTQPMNKNDESQKEEETSNVDVDDDDNGSVPSEPTVQLTPTVNLQGGEEQTHD